MALQFYNNKAWGSRTTVADLMSYAGVPGAWGHQDVARNNARILEYYADKNADEVVGAPAAEAANGYHAYLEGDGVMVNGVAVDDQTKWLLPDVPQAFAMYRHRKAIDAVIAQVWGQAFTLEKSVDIIWTCVQYSSTDAFRLSVLSGRVYSESKTINYSVIPISEE